MNKGTNPRPLILDHATSASAAFHILESGKMKCSSNKDRPYKLMLGEGIYFAENSMQAIKKSNHRNVPQGRATIVSIVNLGNTYETFYKEKSLTKEKIKKHGYDSVRCYKLNTGTEYCVYEVDRVIPLFAKIQFPEETYYLIGTPNGVIKLKQIPIEGMMIKMTQHQIILTDSNNNPFYVLNHEEPQLTNKIITFTHVKDFFFSKVIQRSNKLSIIDCPPLKGELFDDAGFDSYSGNEFFMEEEDTNDVSEYSEEEEEVPSEVHSNDHRKRETPVDIVFVIDATSSTKGFFIDVISKVKSIIDHLNTEFSNILIYSGAVIYRDPVTYKPTQTDEINEQAEIEDRVSKLKKFDITSLHQKSDISEEDSYDYDDDDDDNGLSVDYSNFKFDDLKYPEGQNTLIDLLPVYDNKSSTVYNSKGLGTLINELKHVRSIGGNDGPEDWVGALQVALEDVSWRIDSSKAVVWITDSNAHGERFCGIKDHQEEECKLDPLIRRLIDSNISFVGINVTKECEGGCERTLEQIEKIYSERKDLSFIKQDIRQTSLEWTNELINKFAETVHKTISRLLK